MGEQYAKAGYRGYYDVDFIAGRGGELFITESNVRRTGGTHVYAVASRLFGKRVYVRDIYALVQYLPATPRKTVYILRLFLGFWGRYSLTKNCVRELCLCLKICWRWVRCNTSFLDKIKSAHWRLK